MTPGTYLRLRREKAGLTLLDVALRTGSDPHVSAHRRGENLLDIEADRVTVRPGEAVQLSWAFRFSPLVLDQLIAIHLGERHPVTAPRVCHDCGCSELAPCVDLARQLTCAWVPDAGDWCSACADRAVERALQPTSVAA